MIGYRKEVRMYLKPVHEESGRRAGLKNWPHPRPFPGGRVGARRWAGVLPVRALPVVQHPFGERGRSKAIKGRGFARDPRPVPTATRRGCGLWSRP